MSQNLVVRKIKTLLDADFNQSYDPRASQENLRIGNVFEDFADAGFGILTQIKRSKLTPGVESPAMNLAGPDFHDVPFVPIEDRSVQFCVEFLSGEFGEALAQLRGVSQGRTYSGQAPSKGMHKF